MKFGVPGNVGESIPPESGHTRAEVMTLRSLGVVMAAGQNYAAAKTPAGEESMNEYVVNSSEILIH